MALTNAERQRRFRERRRAGRPRRAAAGAPGGPAEAPPGALDRGRGRAPETRTPLRNRNLGGAVQRRLHGRPIQGPCTITPGSDPAASSRWPPAASTTGRLPIKWTVKQREDKADRFVLGCSGCPDARPSKRPRPRWGAIARDVAAALGVSATAARQALTAARAADRRRGPQVRGEQGRHRGGTHRDCEPRFAVVDPDQHHGNPLDLAHARHRRARHRGASPARLRGSAK